MASLKEIADAGYSASPSSGFGQIMEGIKQGIQSYNKGKDEAYQRDLESVKLYGTLVNDLNMSKEQATSWINKHRSGGLLAKILNRGGSAFQPPPDFNPDMKPANLKQAQELATLKKTQVETKTAQSKANLYDQLGGSTDLSSLDEGLKAGADGQVVMTGPDGKQYKIPPQNVEKAKTRGFR